MTAEIVKFNFHGDELDVVTGDGQPHVAVRRVCDALGIKAQSQTEKLQSDPTFAEGVRIIHTPSPGGLQSTICLDIRLLPLWLASIHPSKVKATVREKLVRYKREAGEALADHFIGRRAAAPALDVSRFMGTVERLCGAVATIAESNSQTVSELAALRAEVEALKAERAAPMKTPKGRRPLPPPTGATADPEPLIAAFFERVRVGTDKMASEWLRLYLATGAPPITATRFGTIAARLPTMKRRQTEKGNAYTRIAAKKVEVV